MVQEHGLHEGDKSRLLRIARRHGYIACAAFIPMTRVRGGALILIRWETFGLRPTQALRYRTSLGGGVVTVVIPRTDLSPPLHLASVYVPVHPRARLTFLRRLRALHVLTQQTIVGADRNTVADLTLDVRYPTGVATSYSNQHASVWDSLMASLGLRDVFRHVEGERARLYTRLGTSVHTRIDCLFAPCHNSDIQWHRVSTAHAQHASWRSDHLTLIAQMNKETERPELGRGPRKINPKIFEEADMCLSIGKLYSEVRNRYPPNEYGHTQVLEKQLASLGSLMRDQSADLAKEAKLNPYLDKVISEGVKTAQTSDPSTRFQNLLKKVEAERAKARRRGPRNRREARRRTLFEEVSTKEFFGKFKGKHTRRYIGELFRVDSRGRVQTSARDQRNKRVDGETVSGVSDMLQTLTTYYTQLMSDKSSDPQAAEILLNKLREQPLSKKDSESIEGKIKEEEVLEAIAHIAPRKSPGPDGIPPEFYRRFATMLSTDMTEMYNECLKNRQLTPTMYLGEIILLYKKKDPRDVRNYRPITLLNLHYKILAKILVSRLKEVIETIISEEQTGFVPGRVITWNSHLLNLIQAYLDETDEEGLFIFLDCEKAFDRVSWTFLRNAARAIGLGPTMCAWIDTLYPDTTPHTTDTDSYDSQLEIIPSPATPCRRVVCNGHRGDYFALQSGVAQGCPCSPILFLLITEGLTRLINDDPSYQGIKVMGRVFKLSQFADDTVCLLRNFSDLRAMWKNIKIYEKATGMKVNVDKTEGLRLGRLRDRRYDIETRDHVHTHVRVGRDGAPRLHLHVSKGWGIKWCEKGEYIISLGIPIGWDFDLDTVWLSKYFKTKALMATWHDVERMSPQGSAMVGNAMVFSRFRYLAHCLAMSEKVSTAIQSDVQALIWGKDVQFDPEELGHGKVRRYMKMNAQYRRRNGGGLGLIHWESHLKGLTDITLFQYCNGRSMAWKPVLDWWFAKLPEGRSAVFSTIPMKRLIASRRRGCESALPPFYRNALSYLRETKMIPVQQDLFLNPQEVRADSLWYSPRFTIRNTNHADTWRDMFGLHTVGDLINPFTGSPYTFRQIRTRIINTLRVEGDMVIEDRGRDIMGFRQRAYIPINRLIKQWQSFARDIGEETLELAAAEEDEGMVQTARYSKVARAIMSAYDWRQGEGLGRQAQGVTEPYLPGGQVGKEGLGFRSRSRTKPAQPGTQRKGGGEIYGAKIQGELAFGYKGERNGQQVLEGVRCTSSGRLVRTGEIISTPPGLHVARAVIWDRGPVGLEGQFFPDPAGWTFEHADAGKTLQHMTIRIRTALHRHRVEEAPSCETKWPQVLKMEVPMREVWARLSNPVMSPRDYKSQFRIIHRSLLTRNIRPAPTHEHEAWPDDECDACRLCLMVPERFSHLARCYCIKKVFRKLVKLANEFKGEVGVLTLNPALIYLGVTSSRSVLPGALSVLHCLLWKFVLISYTRVDTEGTEFKPEEIWRASVLRLHNKIISRHEYLQDRANKQVRLGKNTHPLDSETHCQPLAHFESEDRETVQVSYSTPYRALMATVDITLP
jgi:hypothetical protein